MIGARGLYDRYEINAVVEVMQITTAMITSSDTSIMIKVEA